MSSRGEALAHSRYPHLNASCQRPIRIGRYRTCGKLGYRYEGHQPCNQQLHKVFYISILKPRPSSTSSTASLGVIGFSGASSASITMHGQYRNLDLFPGYP
jgi:hypothetical protein